MATEQGLFVGQEQEHSAGEHVSQLFLCRKESFDLLCFNALVHLGKTTIAAHTLVDSGASDNFMSSGLYSRISASGSKRFQVTRRGWIWVTATGWTAPQQRQQRINMTISIGTYQRELEFVIFNLGTGNDVILGKPWLQLHNLRHEIDHVANHMVIPEESGTIHALTGLQLGVDDPI
jgi:hypothetical protein